MKINVNKLLLIILTTAICVSNMITVNVSGEAEHVDSLAEKDLETVTEEDRADRLAELDWRVFEDEESDIRIIYDITSHWEDHYNVDVTLQNITGERIDNWEICIPADYEIENIWDAKIIDCLDDEYTIHNAEWNQDIEVGGTVSFFMTVKCPQTVYMPSFVDTNGLSEKVGETRYKVKFKKKSICDDKFIGRIIITNQSEENIEDWSVCLKSNFKIIQVWSAVIENENTANDFYYYDIENPGYNQNIAPNQSVEFGFVAACEKEPKLSRLELYDISADIDFSEDEDEDELEYVDEFILDSDYFETREEYEQYLEENGLTDDALIDLDEWQKK